MTLHFLSDAGNLLDCACLAGIVALKHFRRPEVEVIGDEVTVVCLFFSSIPDSSFSSLQHSPSERAPVPLAIHHTPFCLTFAFFPDETTQPVLDPTLLEQRLSAGLMSVALNAQRELCVVQKMGGVPLVAEDVLKIINIAVTKVKELDALVEDSLREDWKGRHVEVR